MKQLISSRDGNQVFGGWRKFTPPYIGLNSNILSAEISANKYFNHTKFGAVKVLVWNNLLAAEMFYSTEKSVQLNMIHDTV